MEGEKWPLRRACEWSIFRACQPASILPQRGCYYCGGAHNLPGKSLSRSKYPLVQEFTGTITGPAVTYPLAGRNLHSNESRRVDWASASRQVASGARVEEGESEESSRVPRGRGKPACWRYAAGGRNNPADRRFLLADFKCRAENEWPRTENSLLTEIYHSLRSFP